MRRSVVGRLMLAAGILLAAAGSLVYMILDSSIGSGRNTGLALVVGGIPVVVGLLSIWGGWAILRRGPP